MITQQRLKELFNYDPETGVFTRLQLVGGGVKVGDIAGTLSNGYVSIMISKKRYKAHRLAWLYMTGSFPCKFIDHINGIKHCNIWENLREATGSQNLCNVGKHKNNTSGHKGVTWKKQRGMWTASARLHGTQRHLGYYADPKDASKAYQDFCKKHHGEFFKE